MKKSRKRYLFPYRNNSGSVLIIIIWMLVFFSILSSALYSITSSYITLFRRLEDRFVSRYLAEGACVDAEAQRRIDKTPYDTIGKLRKEREKELGNGKFIYKLIDEESKININKAPKEVLARLPGIDEKEAEKILASELKPFQLKEELLLVEGVTEENFNKFKDLITIYGEGKVNINTVSPQALEVLGMSEGVIRAVQEFRSGRDGKEGTEDDGVFEKVDIADMVNKLGLVAGDKTDFLNIVNQLTVSSKYFTVECETKILNRSAAKYAIVIDKDKIKEWREF